MWFDMVVGLVIVELVGCVAGFLTTVSMVPEIIDTFKTKDVADVSYAWLISAWVGFVVWTAYGFMINSLPVIIFSIVACVLYTVMFILKVKYSERK